MYINATAALHFKVLSFLNDSYWGFLSKLLASMMRNYFPKRASGAPLHTLSKSYDVPVGFVAPSPLNWGNSLLYLRSPKGGCCSVSDDWSCFCTHPTGVLLLWHISQSVGSLPIPTLYTHNHSWRVLWISIVVLFSCCQRSSASVL